MEKINVKAMSEFGRKPQDRSCRIFLFLFCVLYIILFYWLGVYVRPQADDYVEPFGILKEGTKNFFPYQVQRYLNVNGRITYSLLMWLVAPFPISAYMLLPFLTVLFYAGALEFLVKTFAPEATRSKRCLFALLLTSVTLAFLPSHNETLYWVSGMPYFWTTIFLILLLGLAVRVLRDTSSNQFVLWCGLALCFANGTILEQPCVFQGVVAFFAALWFLKHHDHRRARICAVFWLVSIAAFLVMYLAPGTRVRLGSYADVPLLSRLVRAVAVSIVFGAITVLKFFVKPLTWILLLFLPSLSAVLHIQPNKIERPRLRAWQIFAITILIAPLMHGITGWAGGEGLPLRAESLTVWMMGFTWILLWVFCYDYDVSCWNIQKSSLLKNLFAWRWALLVLALLLNFNCITAIKDLANGNATRYAAEYDANEAKVIAAHERGERDVVVQLPSELPALLVYSTIRPWSSYWVNRGFAELYGVVSIDALPAEICEDRAAIERWRAGNVSDLCRIADDALDKDDGNLAFMLGELYDPKFGKVENVAKDAAKSAEWYRKAAEAGNVQACRRMTRLSMSDGTGSKLARYARAGYWFMRSALPLIRP